MLAGTLLLFAVWIWTQEFHSVKTVVNRVIWHSAITLTSLDVPSTIELILPNTIERKHDAVWKIKS